ncbi:hypothetical protein DEJ03_16110 [Curtobacterium sp. MCLR17_043]|nr:hypothetical protein DEJ03_16110 [Curtobacterium sp. MCLR17_043]PZF11832.1 hypothetical protein DEI98_06860 [Curtobacterium sp. MCLR17_034]
MLGVALFAALHVVMASRMGAALSLEEGRPSRPRWRNGYVEIAQRARSHDQSRELILGRSDLAE